MLSRLRSLFHSLTRRREFEESMTAELQFHIDQYTADLIRSGVPPAEASRRARIAFGSLNTVTGDCRQARRLHIFDELHRQFAYAARLLRKSPGFTATALLTLAICLGANLAIFAVLDAVVLRPLPFPNPGRLVTIFNTYPKAGVDRDGSSLTNYYERRGRIRAFRSLAIYRYDTAIVGETGSTAREPVTRVSPDFFTTVGTGPALGRAFTDAETTYQTDNVAILSDSYWRQFYHSDPAILGKNIRVDSLPKIVVGVLPPGFQFLSSESRIYLPLSSRLEDRSALQRHSGGNVIQMIARLNPAAKLEEAQSQIDAQNNTLELDDPAAKMMADAGFRSLVVPLHADHVASIRPTLLLLQAGVVALLLIGVVNLLNLLLVRAGGRMKELGIRQALGASRLHTLTEALTETAFLTIIGGLLGLAAGAAGIRLLTALGTDQLPLASQIAFDARVAAAGAATIIVLTIILATPIAWLNLRQRPGLAIQSVSRGGTTGRAAQLLRNGFAVSQVALAFLLLAGTGLLALSLERALQVSPGFHPGHILTGRIVLPWSHYPNDAARLAFTDKLMDNAARIPGVREAGFISNLPFSGHNGKSAATVKGHLLRPGESPRGHYSYSVGGDYFEAMGIALLDGRFLNAADSHRPARTCVVDEDFARYYWPESTAVGRKLSMGSEQQADSETFTVVGVVRRVKQAGLTDESNQGAVYYPYQFRNDGSVFVTVRTTMPPETLGLTLQTTVRQIDPDLPVSDIRSMEARITDSLVARRSPALLAGIFSAIALLLTCLGTYGVLSYAVAQRRREIGVRMALGARPEQIRRHFLLLAGRLLALGIVLGAAAALLAGPAMKSILFHVPALNPSILACAAGVMATVSLAACLVPSHRAARISPMEALADD